MHIRRRKYKSGRVKWQLDCGTINGVRRQPSFDSRAEAEAEMARTKETLTVFGSAAFTWSEADRADYFAAKSRLEPVGVTLMTAVDYYLANAKHSGERMAWAAMHAAAMEDKREAGLRPRYLSQLKSVGEAFGRAGHQLRMADQITSQDVEKWLREGNRTPRTWNTYLICLGALFEWGVERGLVVKNPCKGVKRRRPDDEDICFLTVAQCRALLERAALEKVALPRRDKRGAWCKVRLEDDDFRDCLAFVVIGLFCGLRPERELGVMTWDDVKLESKLVVVTAGRSKTRARRTVDLSDNALAWLALVPDHLRMGKLCPANLRKRWEAMRRAVGLWDEWPHDGLRHTFATYHHAHFRNEGLLQTALGHRSAQMLHAHYRGLATPAAAAEFWGLRPGGEEVQG